MGDGSFFTALTALGPHCSPRSQVEWGRDWEVACWQNASLLRLKADRRKLSGTKLQNEGSDGGAAGEKSESAF